MNRRRFIGVSGFSILGTNSLVMSVSRFLGFGVEDKINDIFSFLGVTESGKIDALKNKTIIADKLNLWSKSNYVLCDDNTFWKGGDKQILIPIQLKTSDNIIIDSVVLVFNLDDDQGIFYAGNLSGFHLEAISRNKKHLANLGDAETIRESVLPSTGKGKLTDLGWSFDTKLGSFELSSVLDKGKISVSSALYVDESAVWQNSFLSESLLVQTHSAII